MKKIITMKSNLLQSLTRSSARKLTITFQPIIWLHWFSINLALVRSNTDAKDPVVSVCFPPTSEHAKRLLFKHSSHSFPFLCQFSYSFPPQIAHKLAVIENGIHICGKVNRITWTENIELRDYHDYSNEKWQDSHRNQINALQLTKSMDLGLREKAIHWSERIHNSTLKKIVRGINTKCYSSSLSYINIHTPSICTLVESYPALWQCIVQPNSVDPL